MATMLPLLPLLLMAAAAVARAQSIDVTAPREGSIAVTGRYYRVSWTPRSVLYKNDVTIALYRAPANRLGAFFGLSDARYQRRIASVPAGDKAYEWPVPLDLDAADDYFVALTYGSGDDKIEAKSGEFRVLRGSRRIAVLQPTAGNVWRQIGTPKTVAWTQTGFDDDERRFNIYLRNANWLASLLTPPLLLAANVTHPPVYVALPANSSYGEYQVEVRWADEAALKGVSESFTIGYPQLRPPPGVYDGPRESGIEPTYSSGGSRSGGGGGGGGGGKMALLLHALVGVVVAAVAAGGG